MMNLLSKYEMQIHWIFKLIKKYLVKTIFDQGAGGTHSNNQSIKKESFLYVFLSFKFLMYQGFQ
jgi:hypothetical protein